MAPTGKLGKIRAPELNPLPSVIYLDAVTTGLLETL